LQLAGGGSIMPAGPKGSEQLTPTRICGLEGEISMADSVYKLIELVGTSTESWEKAAAGAIAQASKSLRDLRIAEVVQLDMQVQNGKVKAYRAKLKVSFKFEAGK
jgi:dodecin